MTLFKRFRSFSQHALLRCTLMACMAVALAGCASNTPDQPSPATETPGPALAPTNEDQDFLATTNEALQQASGSLQNPRFTGITINRQDGIDTFLYNFHGDNGNLLVTYFAHKKEWLVGSVETSSEDTLNPDLIAVGPGGIEKAIADAIGGECADHFTAKLKSNDTWSIITGCNDLHLMVLNAISGEVETLK